MVASSVGEKPEDETQVAKPGTEAEREANSSSRYPNRAVLLTASARPAAPDACIRCPTAHGVAWSSIKHGARSDPSVGGWGRVGKTPAAA